MWQSRKVLVVDDDAVVGRSINRVLSAKGYEVREALSGEAALEELDHREYDLEFTDVRMPGIDGTEMTSRLKQRHPYVPVVVITGYGTEAGERQARDLGVAGYPAPASTLRSPCIGLGMQSACQSPVDRGDSTVAGRGDSGARDPGTISPPQAGERAGAG